MIQANQISQDVTFETVKSFLRSSPLHYVGRLSIQQIDLLLYMLPAAYDTSVTGNERSKAVMEETLNIRRRQLMERQVEAREIAERQKASFLTLVAAYFVALVAVSTCFKSTSLPTTIDGKVQTVGLQPWDLTAGWLGFIIVSAIAIFGYRKFIM